MFIARAGNIHGRLRGWGLGSPEVAVAISGVAFGGVIGFLSGYSVR
jgi:hypothetical protein